jgi:hypothetical protein
MSCSCIGPCGHEPSTTGSVDIDVYRSQVWARYIGLSIAAIACAAIMAALLNSAGNWALQTPTYEQGPNVFMLPFVGWTAFVCAIYSIAVKFAVTTHAMDLGSYKAEVKNGLIFNPITFIFMLVCLPAWPFFICAGAIWIFALWTRGWLKGGRFAENNSVMITPRVYCEKDEIVHTGACPKCGSWNGTPVGHLGRKPL